MAGSYSMPACCHSGDPDMIECALFLRPPGFHPGDLGGAVGKPTNLSSPAVLTLASHVSGQGSIPGGTPPGISGHIDGWLLVVTPM